MLDQCRKLRNRADYDINDEFRLESCMSAIQTSRDIVARADAIGP